MKLPLTILLVFALAGCGLFGGNDRKDKPSNYGGGTTNTGWVIGPVIDGKSKSVGMPARPTIQGAGWNINLPGPGGHVHYVSNFNPPMLVGKTQIVMRYTVTGGGFTAQDGPTPAKVGLEFQRRGDDWSGKGSKQQYRWYSKSRPNLTVGEHTLTVPLQLNSWHDVYGKSDSVGGFNAAMQDLSNVSVVFGGQFAGHGVYATQPSTFTMVSLEVQ